MNSLQSHSEFTEYSYVISYRRLLPLLLCGCCVSALFFIFSVLGYTGMFITNRRVNTQFLIAISMFLLASTILYVLTRRLLKQNSEESLRRFYPKLIYHVSLLIMYYGSIIVSSFDRESISRESMYIFIGLIFAIGLYLSKPLLILFLTSTSLINISFVLVYGRESVYFPYHILSTILLTGVALFFSFILFREREYYYDLLRKFLLQNGATIKAFSAKYGLTTRESEALVFLIEGYTYKEIAVKMNISEHTVKTYTVSVYQKAKVSGKVQLVNLLKNTFSNNLNMTL